MWIKLSINDNTNYENITDIVPVKFTKVHVTNFAWINEFDCMSHSDVYARKIEISYEISCICKFTFPRSNW